MVYSVNVDVMTVKKADPLYTYYFERMSVWIDARDIVLMIYNLTRLYPDYEKFGMASQMQRASVSITANIAEGTSRATKRDQAHFTSIAYSSTIELLNLIIISQEMNYINNEDYQKLRVMIDRVTNKLNALRRKQLGAI